MTGPGYVLCRAARVKPVVSASVRLFPVTVVHVDVAATATATAPVVITITAVVVLVRWQRLLLLLVMHPVVRPVILLLVVLVRRLLVLVMVFLVIPLLLGVMMMVPVVRVLVVVRRYLVPAHRGTGHVVTHVLLGGHGGSRCSGGGCRSGLLVTPVLAAATLRASTPVLLPRGFERRRCRRRVLFVGSLRRPDAGLLCGGRARPTGRLTFADCRVFRRFVVLMLREPAYLGGPEGLMKVWQPAVGLPALAR